ncbi:MAG: PAS domain-containing protein [gamma proteobacterium symbiont of Taylorina sp.]|nr:PAS domain-containing protein [gamma proteobacterium symbiont of Taylorina sp.]
MTIVKKVTLLLLLAGLLPFVIVSYMNYKHAVVTIQNEILDDLKVHAKRQAISIHHEFFHTRKELRRVSSNSLLSEKAPRLFAAYLEKGINSPYFIQKAKSYDQFLAPLLDTNHFYDIFMITPEGDIIFSIRKEVDLNTNLISGPYKHSELAKVFKSALNFSDSGMSDFHYYEPSLEPAAFMADAILYEGKIIGVLAIQIDTTEMYQLLQSYSGLGQTGEVIIASQVAGKALFLNLLRHDPKTAFKQSVPSGSANGIAIQKAVQGDSGTGIVTDYRGNEVLAAWRYLPFSRLGLVVKQDTDEAYASIKELRNWTLFIGFITLSLLIYVAWIIARVVYRLDETREQYEYAINGTEDGLWDWDLNSNKVFFSKKWKSMLGYTDKELNNDYKSWSVRVHPDDIDQAKREVLQAQQEPGRLLENIHRLQHKDGHWMWILARGKTIFDQNGHAIRMVGFHTDISQLKQLELELHEQEEIMIAQSRHAAMGEMIGMIAHQWRQPITVIAMGANNMLVDIELDDVSTPAFKEYAQSILKQTDHLSQTIDDFRNFFRPNKETDEVELGDVMAEAETIIGKSLENSLITLSVKNNNCRKITTFSRELLQVYINLLKNSKEALLENRTKDRRIDVVIHDAAEHIITTICDNGGGIDKAIIDKIFEPYFSTKDKKNGAGLGLYMSKTIVEKHLNGTISIENVEDGICMRIEIPVA